MAWYDDVWNWTKKAVSDVADVATKVAPLLPLFLKAGGKVKEVADTPANRGKLLRHFNKVHKTKISMKLFNDIIASKGGKRLKMM